VSFGTKNPRATRYTLPEVMPVDRVEMRLAQARRWLVATYAAQPGAAPVAEVLEPPPPSLALAEIPADDPLLAPAPSHAPPWEEHRELKRTLPALQPGEIPDFDPEARGTPHHWNHVIKTRVWGKKTRHLGTFNESAQVDVGKVIKFLHRRLDSTGKPVTQFLGHFVDMSRGRAPGWYRGEWLGGVPSSGTLLLSGGLDAEEPDWQKAWHGCRLEALYSIMCHGGLMASKSRARGERFFADAPGIYVFRDDLEHKAQSYMRFVPLFRDGVLWASQWEVLVDRSRKVSKKGTDQWIQQEGSVQLKALWLYGRRAQDLETGWDWQENWDPRLEANPRATLALARGETAPAQPGAASQPGTALGATATATQHRLGAAAQDPHHSHNFQPVSHRFSPVSRFHLNGISIKLMANVI
jgi:hypothetical protein